MFHLSSYGKDLSRLREESGASLAMALLLFLVCSVVGSIVLAAGSAAAGRIASPHAQDQDYYSLLSAADLLKSRMDDAEVIIIRTTVTESTNTRNIAKGEEGIREGDWDKKNEKKTSISSKLNFSPDGIILGEELLYGTAALLPVLKRAAAEYVLFLMDGAEGTMGYGKGDFFPLAETKSSTEGGEGRLEYCMDCVLQPKLPLAQGGLEKAVDDMDVDVQIMMHDDGSLLFLLSKDGRLNLSLHSPMEMSISTSAHSDISYSTDEEKRTQTRTTLSTTQEVYTLHWTDSVLNR